MTTKKKTEPRRLTMLDLMIVKKGPSQYTIVQGGKLEYSGDDYMKAGKMMSWMRSYRWAEVNFFKDGILTETLPAPVYEEPPPPETVDRIPVTSAMVRAARESFNQDRHYPSIPEIKRALEAALDAHYNSDKGHNS